MSATCVGMPPQLVMRCSAIIASASFARHRSSRYVVPPRMSEPGSLVIGPRCANEVAAKVALILGSDAAGAFLVRYGLTGLFVRRDGTQLAMGTWVDLGEPAA